MRLRYKLLPALLLAGLSSTAFAHCQLTGKTIGWTSNIQFSCDTDTNLTQQGVDFDVTNGATFNSVWGIDASVSVKQTGNQIHLNFGKDWQSQDFIAKKNQTLSFSFSPSTNQFDIQNFHVGPQYPADASVTFTSSTSQNPIPQGTLIRLNSAQGAKLPVQLG
ncbi:hypothetical protein [Dongshaea marina]|uniref:hypothetical protein n=1 Tax=Dongshaea marina TaxID=2047966 RepID=UPI00131EF598|nr:hypothetical protein [Dongshaea marina]